MIGNYRRILTVGCQLHADLGRVHDAVRPTQQSYQPPKSLAPWWSPSMRALDVGVSFSQDVCTVCSLNLCKFCVRHSIVTLVTAATLRNHVCRRWTKGRTGCRVHSPNDSSSPCFQFV